MNAYLLLENGFMVEGNLFGHSHNVFGKLKINDKGCLELDGLHTNDACLLTTCSASLKEGNSVFFSSEIESIKSFMQSSGSSYAKLVVDSLDVEYHLYDIKTFIPNTNSANCNKSGKEAA